ncbi:serine hydrolase domain-containing protein [Mycobacterium sp.]|uniref:serine hydrolase domain-containing protein n=1 Tax=Mycobacterium sp. TaxID=1785 RepID=UPI003D0EEE6A
MIDAMSRDLVDPATVGVNAARLDALIRRVRTEVDIGRLPSAQLALARRGRLVAFETVGDAGVSVAEPRYLLQSAGRPYVASAAWKLIGDGRLDVSEPVADIIDEFATHGKDSITVEHVMTHTAGIPFAPLGYPKMADRGRRLEAFAKWRLDEPPGQTFQFHLTSAGWVIAEIVERRSGMPLPEFLRREIAEPLGLGAALGVSRDDQKAGVAPMRCTDGDGSDVDPWGPWYLNNPDIVAAGEPSHAVVASAADIGLHYQALLAALAGDDRLWSPEVIADAVRARVTAVPVGEQIYGGSQLRTSMGLFVTVRGPDAGSWMPPNASPEAFGNGGAAYQLAFADPATGLSFALLSNGYPQSGYDYTPGGVALLRDVGNLAAGCSLPD